MEGSEKNALPEFEFLNEMKSNVTEPLRKDKLLELLKVAEMVSHWSRLNPIKILQMYTLNAAKLGEILENLPSEPPFTRTDSWIYLVPPEMDNDVMEELGYRKNASETGYVKVNSDNEIREIEDESGLGDTSIPEGFVRKEQNSERKCMLISSSAKCPKENRTTNRQRIDEFKEIKIYSSDECQRKEVNGIHHSIAESAFLSAVNEQPKAKLRSKTLCTSKCTAADIENNVSSFDGQGNTVSRLSEDKICIGNLKQDREFAQEKKSVPVEDSERIKCVPTNPHIETLHEILRKQLAKFSRSLELGFEWIDVHLSCSQFDRKESLAAAEHFERIFLNWRCTADQIVDDLLSYYHDRGVTIGEHINCPQIVDFIAAAHEMDVTQYRSVLFHLHRIRNFYVLGSELVFLHLNRFGLTEQEELIQN